MSDWLLVANPAWAGLQPPAEPMRESACCDHSYLVTVQCRCGEQMHMHQSSWQRAMPHEGIASRCHGCGQTLLFPAGYFDQVLGEMRRQGWIA